MKYATGAALIVLAGVLWSVQGLIIRLIPDTGAWAIYAEAEIMPT